MKNKNIIGLGGVAGSGKDLFYSLLSQKVDVKRFSLADELKRETYEWCMKHYNIDPVNCSREQKEIVRPFLVFHGGQKRNQTSGRYWIKKLNEKLKLNVDLGIDVQYGLRYSDIH